MPTGELFEKSAGRLEEITLGMQIGVDGGRNFVTPTHSSGEGECRFQRLSAKGRMASASFARAQKGTIDSARLGTICPVCRDQAAASCPGFRHWGASLQNPT
ncbi:hypothetical protein BN77_p10269 [Rhizobium mesoamericanum STM3625]|uniref:Uncharacterized protein n=1 Tax=Rhizobium mesoamericanum STM3625 TaxID=1211777 RepID=K0PYI2_9HYPH|nr:hypothetical protein BN77_p10269 [Rhizobium mesoamericanum STM3625]